MRHNRLQSKARVIARRMIAGELTPADACQQLGLYSNWVPEYFSTEDKDFLRGVNSETDTLPVGVLKENWHQDFLPAKLKELEEYESQIYERVREVCEQILERAKQSASTSDAVELEQL